MSGRRLSLVLLFSLTAMACGERAGTERAPAQRAAPASAQAAGMCREHAVPEALCTKCNPALAAVFQAKGDFCEEHGFPESFCPTCNPDAEFPELGTAPSVTADRGGGQVALEARVVRLSSPDIEEAAGIRTVTARRTQAADFVECTAQIAFDSDRIADVRAIVPGIVRRVGVELGENVRRGAVLFELESTRIGDIQAALHTARERVRTAQANLSRKRELRASEIASARQVEVAEQELAAAQADAQAAGSTLRMAGAAQAASSGRYALTAPIAGTIVRRPAVVGLLATESTSLATVADTTTMWALCEVPEFDAARIALGQPVQVAVDGSDDEPLRGEVTWIAAEVDPRTRTVTARAEVPNPHGRLRANQFARASIETGAARTAVSVPRSAVQRVDDREIVFVRTAQGVYEPRVVQRHGGGEFVQVEGNVKDGDAVVTTGAILLRTEVMPGSIGAGCCEVEPQGGATRGD